MLTHPLLAPLWRWWWPSSRSPCTVWPPCTAEINTWRPAAEKKAGVKHKHRPHTYKSSPIIRYTGTKPLLIQQNDGHNKGQGCFVWGGLTDKMLAHAGLFFTLGLFQTGTNGSKDRIWDKTYIIQELVKHTHTHTHLWCFSTAMFYSQRVTTCRKRNESKTGRERTRVITKQARTQRAARNEPFG